MRTFKTYEDALESDAVEITERDSAGRPLKAVFLEDVGIEGSPIPVVPVGAEWGANTEHLDGGSAPLL